MSHQYTIGGISIDVATDLPTLESDGFADASLRATFVESDEYGAISSPELRRLAGPMDTAGAIDHEALRCWLPTDNHEPLHRAWLLRQMAPVFSAVLRRLVLHAGAVVVDGRVMAFVGESGAGKSTLATFLAGRGHPRVADDLLPVRFDTSPGIPTDGGLHPISAIYFLRRSGSGPTDLAPVAGADAMDRMVRHGFGEHGDPPTWQFQFDAYHRIIESTPLFDLQIPDDLAALPEVANALIGSETPSLAGDAAEDLG